MNADLLRYRPKDSTKEEFTATWNNAHYTLEPLARLILARIRAVEVTKDDCAAGLGAVAWAAGAKDALVKLYQLLPAAARTAAESDNNPLI